MFSGVLALLGRSLRIDARSWQAHLARFGLLMGIYVSLAFIFSVNLGFGAPGLHFFHAVVWMNIIFMTLLGIGFFSTTISEEKEEDTLGLMQMAGISSLGILAGKTGGRLVQALLLIAVQYPFTLLAITLGGVTAIQIRCAFVGLTAYMLLMAGLGLLCSTISARNRTASARMIMGLFVYFIVPYVVYETQRVLLQSRLLPFNSLWVRLLQSLESTCLYLQISEIMTTGFGESPWSLQVFSNLAGGVACFLLSWGVFGVCTRNPSAEQTSRGLLTVQRGVFRWFSPGRPRWNPYVWKDFHFVGGGIGMVLVRAAFYFGLLLVSFGLSELWWSGSNQAQAYEFAIGTYQVFLLFAVSIDLALLASRTLNDEIRGQTLAAIAMLPESMTSAIYSKFFGALLAGAPGPCCLVFATLATGAGRANVHEFSEHAAIAFFFLEHFALVPHLAMVLALYLRWGIVPLAIGVSIASFFFWAVLIDSAAMGPGGEEVMAGFADVVIALVCLACHFWIFSRIRKVAARG